MAGQRYHFLDGLRGVAMLLGIVVYLVPFFFVTCPALVLQAPFVEVFYPLVTIIFGTALMASALAGYALLIGRLSVPLRILFFLYKEKNILLYVRREKSI